jgi:hypothetical protein
MGAKKIYDYYKNKNIIIEKEYKFKDCKNIYPLAFDFVIFDNNGKLLYLIEYQGEQHYHPIELYGGMDALINNKMKDKIKYNYCKENNIKLYIIPYWDFNIIEQILKDIIKSNS